eukprot:6931712-Prymnesium_polylepis.1
MAARLQPVKVPRVGWPVAKLASWTAVAGGAVAVTPIPGVVAATAWGLLPAGFAAMSLERHQ